MAVWVLGRRDEGEVALRSPKRRGEKGTSCFCFVPLLSENYELILD